MGAGLLAMSARISIGEWDEAEACAAQAEALRALRCQRGQGFLYSRPLPAEEAGRLLAVGSRLHHHQ